MDRQIRISAVLLAGMFTKGNRIRTDVLDGPDADAELVDVHVDDHLVVVLTLDRPVSEPVLQDIAVDRSALFPATVEDVIARGEAVQG